MRYAWLLVLAGCGDWRTLDPTAQDRAIEVERNRRVERAVAGLTHEAESVRSEARRVLVREPEIREALVLAVQYGDGPRAEAVIAVLEARKERRLARALVERWPVAVGARIAVAAAFARLGQEEVVPDLAHLLGVEESAAVRERLCRALGVLGGAHGLDALGRAALEPALPVSLEAIRALGQLGRPEAIGPLLSAWRAHGDAARGAAAAEGLGRLRARAAVDDLGLGLRSDAPTVRLACVEALAGIGDARAVPVLIDALGDRSWAVFVAAEKALRRTTGANPPVEPGDPDTLQPRTRKAWQNWHSGRP
jgi:HEAT repeat protein